MERTEFDRRVMPEPNTGCWIWTGRQSSDGYGKLHSESNHGFVFAHRYSYYLTYGDFDHSLLVCHTCDNRFCVNPQHLYLGTVQDNNADRERRNRRNPVGLKNGRSVLTPSDVIAIRKAFSERSATRRMLANEFGVTYCTITSVVMGITWNHL